MTRNVHLMPGRRLRPAHALLLATAFTGVASTAAFAETLSVTGIAPAAGAYGLSVPSVEIVDGNLDEAQVRALFTGAEGTLAPLATLTAKSVTIPALTFNYAVDASATEPLALTYHNLVLNDVVDGVAASATIEGADFTAGEGTKGTLGEMSVGHFDLGGLLGFYGLAPAATGTEIKEVYSDFRFAGGTFGAGDLFSCTFGPAEVGGFSARPLKYNMAEIQSLIVEAEAAQTAGTPVPPEDVRKIALFYTDLLTAFSSSPMSLDGIDCSGKDENGKPMAFSIGEIAADGFEPAKYPAVSVDDLKIDVADEGHVNVGNFTWKKMDFSTAIAIIEAATTLDEAFFEANWRKLVPAMDGFSIAGLDVDTPDPEKPGERIKGTMGSFDATLGNYINGIPADITLRLGNFILPLTEEMTDLPVADLRARGIEQLDVSVGTSLKWDQASSTITADDVTFDLGSLGKLTLSGTFGNATDALFGDDNDAAMLAAQMITLKDVTLDVEDRGIGSILVAMGARDAGQPEEAFRTAVAGMAQGLTLAFLGNTTEALTAAQQLGTFLQGASHLKLTITSKDEAGIGLADLAAAETNPAALAGKLDVVAVADGEPVVLPLVEQSATTGQGQGNAEGETVQDQKRNLKNTQ
ncbi:MAG: hypothetical protein J0I99_11885 [Devosia sp.]|uniref:hypothetical protein n=1 Tax=Devosia sp. TaxID=1871048 RepID=UPI001ACAD0DF|nr:hypothetical protein [Devosia sp.]MBN9316434.1 hypothetical protein [Devosia sp.]